MLPDSGPLCACRVVTVNAALAASRASALRALRRLKMPHNASSKASVSRIQT